MIAAVHELVEKEAYIGDYHRCVAEYLKACRKPFEEGILSHKTISSTDKQVLVNMDKGFQFFQQREDELSGKYPGMHTMYTQSNIHTVANGYIDVKLKSPLQRNFLAWQVCEHLSFSLISPTPKTLS